MYIDDSNYIDYVRLLSDPHTFQSHRGICSHICRCNNRPGIEGCISPFSQRIHPHLDLPKNPFEQEHHVHSTCMLVHQLHECNHISYVLLVKYCYHGMLNLQYLLSNKSKTLRMLKIKRSIINKTNKDVPNKKKITKIIT